MATTTTVARYLDRERQALERYLPGLRERLSGRTLMELESADAPAIIAFKETRGAGLLIPADYGGLGAGPVDAVRVQRAIGSVSPSLAVATTMHHFSIATLVEMCATSSGVEWMLLQAIADQRLLVSSGFAEGQPGRGILAPTMRAIPVEGGLRVTGSKKPCSLSRSMDLLTASVTVSAGEAAGERLAVVLVPASDPGIVRRPFWANWVLAGAESDEVILRDVHVPTQLVFYSGETRQLDTVQVSGFLWFELLITASYVGIASGLAERALLAHKGTEVDRARLLALIEGAAAALEGVARGMAAGEDGEDALARMLVVRYAVQQALEAGTMLAAELLGGTGFIFSSDVSYLLAAARALAFHPPSRTQMAAALVNHADGMPLVIP